MRSRFTLLLTVLLFVNQSLLFAQTDVDEDGDGYVDRPARYKSLSLKYNGDSMRIKSAEGNYAHEEQLTFEFGGEGSTFAPLLYWQGSEKFDTVSENKPALVVLIYLDEPLITGFTKSFLLLDFGVLPHNQRATINRLMCLPEDERPEVETYMIRHPGIRLISEKHKGTPEGVEVLKRVFHADSWNCDNKVIRSGYLHITKAAPYKKVLPSGTISSYGNCARSCALWSPRACNGWARLSDRRFCAIFLAASLLL